MPRTFNANRDLTSDGLHTYTYDAEGRLSTATTGATDTSPTTRYAHNALGQRVFKTEPQYPSAEGDESDAGFMASLTSFFSRLWSPSTTKAEALGYTYAYDEQGTLIGEYGMGGAHSSGIKQYIYLPTPSGPMPIAMMVNDTRYAITADHLNTPRRANTVDGSLRWQWGYSAFGEEPPTIADRRFTKVAALETDFSLNLRYPGQYFDQESGLHYNYFRTYDPVTGRYTQADPIGLDGGLNRFGYVNANPLEYIDAQGLAAGAVKWMNVPRPQLPCQCPVIPPIPPGVSVCKNMDDAKDRWDPRWFRDQVQNKGPWDYKQQGSNYQDFGNFNYGAAGSAFGFPGQILSRMAGWAQRQAGTSKTEWGNPLGTAPYGDDPKDQEMIQKGIEYVRCKCQ